MYFVGWSINSYISAMKPITLLMLLGLFVLASCSKRYYNPAMYKNDIAYMPKPASFDSVKQAFYITGGLNTADGSNYDETITFGTLDVSSGHTFKSLNVAYGAFGFAGGVSRGSNNSTDRYAFNSKSFYGAGARFSANLYEHQNNADIRYLGVEAVYSSEYGSYADYRKQVKGANNYYAITGTQLVTVGLTSEILWHTRWSNNTQYALRMFVGTKLGNHKYTDDIEDFDVKRLKTLYVNLGYFMQYKRFMGSLNLNFFSSGSLRLGYKF